MLAPFASRGNSGTSLSPEISPAESTAALYLSEPGGVLPQLPAPPNLESAVALIELAGHPHILGREAFAILDEAGCCEQLALVAVGAAGARVISAEGWSET